MLKLQYLVFFYSANKKGDKFYVRKLARGKREKKRLRIPVLKFAEGISIFSEEIFLFLLYF